MTFFCRYEEGLAVEIVLRRATEDDCTKRLVVIRNEILRTVSERSRMLHICGFYKDVYRSCSKTNSEVYLRQFYILKS